MEPGDQRLEEMRPLSHGKLIEHVAGTRSNTLTHQAALAELERRKNEAIGFRAWAAVGISIASLAVAILAHRQRVNEAAAIFVMEEARREIRRLSDENAALMEDASAREKEIQSKLESLTR